MNLAIRVFLFLMVLAATEASAQGSTAETLREARTLYQALDVERALVLLRRVVSPSSPFEVTPAQRVEAYKYLGASLAFIGMEDSAVVYFRAALERDPFTDLDPQTFTPAQLGAFGQARQRTFAVGARPVAPVRLQPRTEQVTFTVFSTHSGSMHAELTSDRDSTPTVLFQGESDGLREIRWGGLVGGGRLAPPARYRLAIRAQGTNANSPVSADVYFDVAHDLPPLEDTLPDLRYTDLLPEQQPATVGRQELLAGMGVAVSALIMATVMTDGGVEASRGPAFAAMVGGAGAISGIAAFFWHRSHRVIDANVAENRRRDDARAKENAAIRQRNSEKVARTVLVISPALAPAGAR